MSGCHKTVKPPQRYCPEHRREGAQRDRPMHGAERHVDVKLYSTKKWKLMRRRILARDPICVSCRSARATHVDHIIPRKHGGSDDQRNLQGLCARCHTAKTGRGE